MECDVFIFCLNFAFVCLVQLSLKRELLVNYIYKYACLYVSRTFNYSFTYYVFSYLVFRVFYHRLMMVNDLKYFAFII